MIIDVDAEGSVVLERNTDGAPALWVRTLDANHVAGAVMFLFGGFLGNILVTGDFRSDGNLKIENLDRLYLDNTFLCPSYNFASREVVLNRFLAFIESLPEHYRIFVGTNALGKEEVLVAAARRLNERVCVSREKMETLKLLENLPDVFTRDASSARIFTVSKFALNKKFLEAERAKNSPAVGVILSALYHKWQGEDAPYVNAESYGLYVFEYSDHSSYDEILEFVSRMRPRTVIPIIRCNSVTGFMRKRPGYLESIENMSVFDPFLSRNVALPHQGENSAKCVYQNAKRNQAVAPVPVLPPPRRVPKGIHYATSTSNSSGAFQESVQVPEESAPVPEESALVPEESALVPEESAPAPEESALVPEESAPVPEESAPVREESAPVPEESAPTAPGGRQPQTCLEIDLLKESQKLERLVSDDAVLPKSLPLIEQCLDSIIRMLD